jgi:pyrophosphate--fructose-6-phosphate 1-phosphotransferase
MDLLEHDGFLPELGLSPERLAIHGIYIPEMSIDIDAEADRLREVMDDLDNVNIFVSEGAGVEDIVQRMEADGESVPRDAFGHVKLDAVNPGKYFAEQFARKVGAEKVMVQKSGYYSRAAAANTDDLRLIKSCVDLAVECALRREGGVIGHDEDHDNRLRAIEFSRIKGGKPFNIATDWFVDLLDEIGQPPARPSHHSHP